MNESLNIMMEKFKFELNQSFIKTAEKYNLPAYLMEGAVIELLSNVRNQKNMELLMEIERAKENKEEKEGEE